jgi:hypothetical protein
MSEFFHPLRPDTPQTTSRSHSRRLDQLERRKHGPWRNAGDPGQPICLLTPDPNYIGGVGFRFRRWLGGGTNLQIALLGATPGQIVGTLTSTWYVFGEGRIPLEGHNNGAAQGFYVDTSNGNIVVGV